MTYPLILLLLISLPELNSFFGDYQLKDAESGRTIEVFVGRTDSDTVIEARVGILHYLEALTLRGDTLKVKYRRFSAGLLSFTVRYSPLRTRMVLPLRTDTIVYEGTEHRPGPDRQIKSRIIVTESDSIFRIVSRTEREGSEDDVSIMEMNEDYSLRVIEMDLPAFMHLYRLGGFKSPHFRLESE
ncbi:MAG: hypothetical protein R6U31_01030 [bacterium]